MYYHFTEDCLIGISLIDSEHEHLFKLINKTQELISNSTLTTELVKELADELLAYADTHFEHEETYMRQNNDPELPRQQREHAAFSFKIKSMYEDLQKTDSKNLASAAAELLDFLVKWLYRHIISSDMMIGKLAPLAAAVSNDQNAPADGELQMKSFLKFTDKYKTNIAFVDDEHKKLFEIIEHCYEVIHDETFDDKYDEIIYILNDLREYTEQHFAHEEAYMERIQYEGLSAQRLAHEAFVDRLREVNPYDVDDNQDAYLDETVEFLLGWLQNHILLSDKLIPVVEMEDETSAN
jgi:hemerythrin